MKPALWITAVIYTFLSITASLHFYINSIEISNNYQKPLGESFGVLSATSKGVSSHLIYGFLPYWTLNKVEYIQLDKLTDVAYFALSIKGNGEIKTIGEDGFADPGYNKWKNSEELDTLILKAKRAGVRFALTVISHNDDVTYEFLDCRDCWDTLLSEIITELDSKQITDLNMDFELTEPDAKEGYAFKYSQLVNFLNTRLDRHYGNSFVVTSTLPDSTYKPRITDITSLAKASDALFIMAYDFHRPTSDSAGPVAPISGAGKVSEYDVLTMLKDYLTLAPEEKLILGVPYYGYNWLVYSNTPNSTRIPGNDVLGYSISQTYEHLIATKLENKPTVLWDSLGQVPFFTYFNYEKGTLRQVYYENEDSLRIKYKLVKKRNLAGVGIWALGYDGGYQELWNLLDEEFIN